MSTRPDAAPLPEPWSDEDFRAVEAILRLRSHGGTLTLQRLNLIRSRLKERLVVRGIPSFRAFHERHLLARTDGPGFQLLIDLTTVNHTSFFREPIPLGRLADELATLVRGRIPGGVPVRVWSAGCSAGQEPYSLAMMLTEVLPGLMPSVIEIRATDISMGIVRTAARGIYEARELSEVSPDRLRRFFLRGRAMRQGMYRITPEIRSLITFQQFDLLKPSWPLPTVFDAILCRNVAIYFAESARPVLLDRLAERLRPGGWLVVGNAEILPERPGLLERIAPSIFRRVLTS